MTVASPLSSAGEPPAAAPGDVLLDVANLHCRRGSGAGAYRVSLPRLQLAAGDVLAVTGASGSGKSTLLEVLGLVAAPLPGARFTWHAGGARVDLADLWQRDAEHRLANLRASQIGFAMQTGGLLPFLSVRENLAVNRRLLGLPAFDDGLDHLVRHLELGSLLDALPARLSVGQQQRASIGRALAHRPALLLADEPTSALDPCLAGRVLALLLESAAEVGTAVVLATHEQARVRSLGLRELTAETLPTTADAAAGAVFSEKAA